RPRPGPAQCCALPIASRCPSPPPPSARSPPFPYTTLFRSGGDVRAVRGGGAQQRDHVPGVVDLGVPVEHRAGERRALQRRGEAQDRKSTRLNSSHVKISYAVFCLTKKRAHL